ncbi:MAG: hypothetical protein C4542_03840 [Dehalococcoidia bacterium]|nr:MAG: hypothetical protein C4542_03840 [Dehalococcoidia bacterium]
MVADSEFTILQPELACQTSQIVRRVIISLHQSGKKNLGHIKKTNYSRFKHKKERTVTGRPLFQIGANED